MIKLSATLVATKASQQHRTGEANSGTEQSLSPWVTQTPVHIDLEHFPGSWALHWGVRTSAETIEGNHERWTVQSFDSNTDLFTVCGSYEHSKVIHPGDPGGLSGQTCLAQTLHNERQRRRNRPVRVADICNAHYVAATTFGLSYACCAQIGCLLWEVWYIHSCGNFSVRGLKR